MWRHDRSPDLTPDVTTELTGEFTGKVTGTMGGDGQGEGRDNAAGLAAADRRIDRRIDRRKDRRTGHRTGHRIGRRIGRRIDWATTSLTPYGMSVWALILAACGGGGGGGGGGPTTSGPTPAQAPTAQPKMVEKSGLAYNRPLEGGVALLDVNGNRRIDGEDIRLGTVNAQGEYRGQVPEALHNQPVIIDTSGTKYASQLPGTLLAPKNSRVVSPLTHGLVTGEIERSDLPDEFDPYNDNPYQEPPASEDNSEARRELFEAVKKALPVVGRNLSRTESTTPPKPTGPGGRQPADRSAGDAEGGG